jgi:histone H2A
MASVLEYLCAEILELAGNVAMDVKRKRITAQHIQLAVRGDEELSLLLTAVVIPGGGVLPHVHQELEQLPDCKVKRAKAIRVVQDF